MTKKPTKQEIAQAYLEGKITNRDTLAVFISNWETQQKIDEENLTTKKVLEQVIKNVKGIKGDKGEKGDSIEGKQGKQGIQGIQGKKGDRGITGDRGTDAKLIDTSKIATDAQKGVLDALKDQIPTIDQIAEELPQRGDLVRDSLELLREDDRLDKSAIKGLDDYDEVSRLARLPKTVGGLGSPAGALRMDGNNSPMANIDWGGFKITNLGTPTSDADATTKKYVDAAVASAGGGTVSDEAYGATWDDVTDEAASKNALYDVINGLPGGHDVITLDVNADTLLSLSTQELGLDTQAANKIFSGPATGVDAVPTFRSLVAADIPDVSATYAVVDQAMYIGTTSVAINRASATLNLAGIGTVNTHTIPGGTGTFALTTDITGTNSGTNTGDQTDITGISSTKAEFNTACSDGTFLYTGDAPTAHAASHAVAGADTVFPADPGADRHLMWDDDPGALVWSDLSSIYAAIAQTMYIGTTQVAINRASAALTLAGLTLTTPDIGTPSGGTLTSCTGLPYSGLADGTDGNLITWGADGVIALVATGDAGQVLISAGAGQPPAFGAAGAADNLGNHIATQDLVSDTADTDSLGSTTKEWLNLYIGDAGKIYLGLGQDCSIERSAANEMTLTATSGVTIESVKMDGGVVTGATSITSTAFTGDVTGDCTGSSGSCTGESATVATITTLAPDTATTQATQASITTCVNLVSVGALDSGSITANFGSINNGASAITTTGDITGGGIHVTGDTAANDNAALGYTATEGLIMTGQGSTNDLTFKNDADAEVMKVLTGTTELTMAGNIQLGETSIKLDALLSGDAKWSGITISGLSGVTTLAIGDLIYLNANDSRWELVDANLSDGYDKQLGIALTAAADGAALEVLVFGKVRSATFPAFTVGSPLYISETAGDMTHTAPTTTDACVRLLGYALTQEDMLFNPSPNYYTHT